MQDKYGRKIDYMRISLTDRCNLRCRYCMPDGIELVPMKNILTYEEIELICQAAAELGIRRLKLTGGEPLVRLGCAELVGRLKAVPGIEQVTLTTNGVLISKYLPELLANGLTIGVETGDDNALAFMRKGYTSQDILTQCKRLEQAGIEYGFFYLTSISGKGKGEVGAKASANIFNQLHPFLIGPNMLTIYPESELYQEIQNGNWEEEGELEKYRELRALVENLNISTYFAAMGASNAFQLRGRLPDDKKHLLNTLDKIISEVSEEDLRHYRKNLRHL